jgi:hypothetical protein
MFDGALVFLRNSGVRASERKSAERLLDRATLLRAVNLPFRAGPVHKDMEKKLNSVGYSALPFFYTHP